MKEKLQSFMAAMLFSAGLISPALAQTEVTDLYIENPSFEDERDGSTTQVSPTLQGWERNYVDGYNWNGCNEDWATDGARSYGIWKPAIDSDFELSQELTLPNGIYTVTVDMTVSRVSQSSRMNGQRLFANELEAFYPAHAETEADNGAPWELKLTVQVTDGTLKIGIRTDGGTDYGIGWFKVDNFRLYFYEGEDAYLKYLEGKLYDLYDKIEQQYLKEIPPGNADAFLALADQILDSVDGSDDPEEYEAAIEEMEQLIQDMQPALDIYSEFQNLIEDAFILLEESYPGLAEFTTAIEKAQGLFDSSTALIEDFESAIEELNKAIVAYKKSNFVNATPNNPVDATFLVANSDMELGTEGWDIDGFTTINTGEKYDNFDGIFIEKYVGGPGTLANASASQTIMNVPNGTYKLSAAMIATQQSDPELIVTGTYLFANSVNREVATGDGVGTLFDLNVVVTDGTITLGMKTINTTANWVGFDNVELSYLGKDLASYQEVFDEMLASAQEMYNDSYLLPRDKNHLKEAIEQAIAADKSTTDALEAAINDLSAALEIAEAEMILYTDFRAGSFAKAMEVAENFDFVYSAALSTLITTYLISVEEVLEADTTTNAVFPALTEEIDRYLTFVDAYHSLDVVKEGLSSDELRDMLTNVLAEQLAEVDEDGNKIEEANEILEIFLDFVESYVALDDYAAEVTPIYDPLKSLLPSVLSGQLNVVAEDYTKIPEVKAIYSSVISFSRVVTTGLETIYDENYDLDLRVALNDEIEEEIDNVEVDNTVAPAAEIRLIKSLAAVRASNLEEGDEMTYAIVNPEINGNSNDVIPNGWDAIKIDGNTFTTTSQHWTGDGSNRYFDSWNGTAGVVKFTTSQVIKGIPNGTYRLVAAARADGNGAYIYAKGYRGIKAAEIEKNGASGGSIWAGADEDSELKLVNGGNGYGWSWIEVDDIMVSDHTLIIGSSSDNEFIGEGNWNGTWLSIDDFKLYYVNNKHWSVGVEDVDSDASGLIAYEVNGVIIVEGADDYSIYTLNGIQVPANAQLSSGIYIVKAGSKAVKVAVK